MLIQFPFARTPMRQSSVLPQWQCTGPAAVCACGRTLRGAVGSVGTSSHDSCWSGVESGVCGCEAACRWLVTLVAFKLLPHLRLQLCVLSWVSWSDWLCGKVERNNMHGTPRSTYCTGSAPTWVTVPRCCHCCQCRRPYNHGAPPHCATEPHRYHSYTHFSYTLLRSPRSHLIPAFAASTIYLCPTLSTSPLFALRSSRCHHAYHP